MRRILAVTALAATLTATGCSATPPPVSAQVQSYYDAHSGLPTKAPQPVVITFGAVGDSVTAGNSPDIASGKAGTLSWAYYAQGDTRRFVGGFASKGSTTATMSERATNTNADVTVIVAGTNDVSRSTPFTESSANLTAIVQKSGSKKIVVAAIPPNDQFPDRAAAYNAQLAPFVQAQGWTYVDPWTTVRDQSGKWLPGLTGDGLHPTEKAAEAAGKAIGDAISAK